MTDKEGICIKFKQQETMDSMYGSHRVDVSNVYWNILKNLGTDVKLDLIARLSASLLTSVDKKSNASNWVSNLMGKWEDTRNAEEILQDIRSNRSLNKDIEL